MCGTEPAWRYRRLCANSTSRSIPKLQHYRMARLGRIGWAALTDTLLVAPMESRDDLAIGEPLQAFVGLSMRGSRRSIRHPRASQAGPVEKRYLRSTDLNEAMKRVRRPDSAHSLGLTPRFVQMYMNFPLGFYQACAPPLARLRWLAAKAQAWLPAVGALVGLIFFCACGSGLARAWAANAALIAESLGFIALKTDRTGGCFMGLSGE
jgi:hypothetical protein